MERSLTSASSFSARGKQEMRDKMNAEAATIFQKFKRKVNNSNRRVAKYHNNQTLRVEDVIDKWEATIFCNLCGRFIALDDASIDHLIPLSKGGENRIGNVTIVHKWCNHEKGDKDHSQTSMKFKKLYDPGDTGCIMIDSFAAHMLHPYRANSVRRSDLPKEFDDLPYIDQIRIVYDDIDDLIEAEHEMIEKLKSGY